MKICFITKYPPIQGGVSTTSYWLAHGLASSGHEVHVVTNSEEVESPYRTLPSEKNNQYKNINDHGHITVHFTTEKTPKHIPFSKIYFTKLLSLGLDVCEKFGCDIVFAFYLEPYGIVGAIIADYLDVPLIVRHAGSDISRLFEDKNLMSAYAYSLKRATKIITSPSTAKKLIKIGIEKNKFIFNMRDLFPNDAYYSKKTSKDFNKPITIGVYNKFGKSKGIGEIIEALDILAKNGETFRLRIISGGEFFLSLKNKIKNSSKDLQKMIELKNFIHPTDIPGFIRGCDIVCDLENNFSVASHYPRIPREILMCGSCLVLSEELYQKMRYRFLLKNMKNFVLVKNPRNIIELSEILNTLIKDRESVYEIGANGALLFGSGEDDYLESMSEISKILDGARYDYHISRI